MALLIINQHTRFTQFNVPKFLPIVFSPRELTSWLETAAPKSSKPIINSIEYPLASLCCFLIQVTLWPLAIAMWRLKI
jgi:hypothetical protein